MEQPLVNGTSPPHSEGRKDSDSETSSVSQSATVPSHHASVLAEDGLIAMVQRALEPEEITQGATGSDQDCPAADAVDPVDVISTEPVTIKSQDSQQPAAQVTSTMSNQQAASKPHIESAPACSHDTVDASESNGKIPEVEAVCAAAIRRM